MKTTVVMVSNRQSRMLHAVCPHCKRKMFVFRSKGFADMWMPCPKCRRDLHIQLASNTVDVTLV